MKLARKKSAKNTSAVKQKSSFDFQEFLSSVNSLNKENYGSAPLPVRLFVLAVLVVLIFALAWFLLLSPKLEEIKTAEENQEALITTYQEKESRARYLDEYKAQIAQMELEFSELLNQLPKETRVSETVEGINMVGVGSGVRFTNITVAEEIEKDFFIEQPIDVTVVGEYHQFGDFITGIAALPRIITMHDFEMTNLQNDFKVMPELQLVLHTSTYRSKDVDVSAEAASDAQGGNSQ